jgi:hypothetical protein
VSAAPPKAPEGFKPKVVSKDAKTLEILGKIVGTHVVGSCLCVLLIGVSLIAFSRAHIHLLFRLFC